MPPLAPPAAAQLDPRGLRFAAAVTTVVLAVALITLNPIVLAFQVVVFAIGAVAGPAASPYPWVFRRVIRPRLGPPDHTEDAPPARFAQGVGLGFALVGLAAELAGITWLAVVAVAFALAAAFLNAAFSFCLGCHAYLLVRRAFPSSRLATSTT